MRDLCLSLDHSGNFFNIIDEKENDMPEVLRAIIVLLFFSKIKALRTFDNDSLYNMLAKSTSGIDGSLAANLTLLSSDLKDILIKSFPEVKQVKLTHEINNNKLDIIATITTGTDVVTNKIYTYER